VASFVVVWFCKSEMICGGMVVLLSWIERDVVVMVVVDGRWWWCCCGHGGW
jgi:hypothetical protein